MIATTNWSANHFRANRVSRLTRNNFTIKVDYNLGDNDKVSARYLYNSDDTGGTSVFPERGACTINDTRRHQQFWYGAWTRVFSAAGFTAFGSGNQERRQFPIEQFQVGNNLSWVRGRHAFRFGAELRPCFPARPPAGALTANPGQYTQTPISGG